MRATDEEGETWRMRVEDSVRAAVEAVDRNSDSGRMEISKHISTRMRRKDTAAEKWRHVGKMAR